MYAAAFAALHTVADRRASLVQAAIERLLIRAYVAYERLAGFADVPDSYRAADAFRGCDELVRHARQNPPPPVLPPVQPAPLPAPVERCVVTADV